MNAVDAIWLSLTVMWVEAVADAANRDERSVALDWLDLQPADVDRTQDRCDAMAPDAVEQLSGGTARGAGQR
jgi:hypothetical protein